METGVYISIDAFYDIAKEEYGYQRERLNKIETKTEFVIGILSAVFTIENVYVINILKTDFSEDSIANIVKVLYKLLSNIPYTLSLILLFISMLMVLYVFFNIRCRIVDIVKLYNLGIYNKPKEEFVPYLAALYVKCCSYNYNKANALFRYINMAIAMTIISVFMFGISCLC